MTCCNIRGQIVSDESMVREQESNRITDSLTGWLGKTLSVPAAVFRTGVASAALDFLSHAQMYGLYVTRSNRGGVSRESSIPRHPLLGGHDHFPSPHLLFPTLRLHLRGLNPFELQSMNAW